jgi:outer membrane protein OmpA-like peptidoglycan-associated protein/tetratricopeptide (TPR) repeat protein
MRYVLFYCILFLALAGYSQVKYSSTNKTAIRNYERAGSYLELNNFSDAKLQLNDAIKEDASFIEAYMLLADVYRVTFDYKNAIQNYKKAYQLNPDFAPERYFYLATSELKTGLYKDAISSFTNYLAKGNPKEERKILTDKYLKDCNFALDAIKHPVAFKPLNLGSNINSVHEEYMASLTTDENSIIFTRQINNNEDFYRSFKKDTSWTKAEYLSSNINTTSYNEGAQCISPDGQFLFFTGCNRPEGLGRCDIYVAQREGDGWSKPVNLGFPVNTKGWESQPSLSADGRTLYFVSDRAGGFGSYDIWKSNLGDGGKWETPVNMGPNINTKYDEQSPFIHPDNETFYFSSDGWTGMGDKDIFISRADTAGEWGPAINLGFPINTYGEERGLTINASGAKAYFSSNNFSGFGGFDIYSFNIPQAIKPKPTNYVKGKVFDAITRKPLDALVDIIDLKTGNSLHASYANKIDGTFLAALPNNKVYGLNVNQPGYLFYSENFSVERYKPGEPVILEVPLQKIEVGNKVVLKNIFFDTNKFLIKDESKPELAILIDFLAENPGVKIEIRGHTDNIGDDQSNLILSHNRSKAVFNYLVKEGISSERLTSRGFGEKDPIANNNTISGRANNRRTEFIITGIK